MATVITRFLRKFVAPALPASPLEYIRTDEDQFRNMLRLYFNQIDSATQQLITNNNLLYSVYTVATLPSAVTSGIGARTFVSDALGPTFGATVVTGGAVATPVYSDGTDWKVG